VIIEDPGYLSSPKDVRFLPGAARAVALLNQAGLAVVLVTNQSGIGRGYYTWHEFEAVQAVVTAGLGDAGAWLDGLWACAYHEDGRGEYRKSDHPFRKPNPGMLLEAAAEMELDLTLAWMIGDKESDLEAGFRAGVRGVIAVSQGAQDVAASFRRKHTGELEVLDCKDLSEAAAVILGPTPCIPEPPHA
jgi:D-glycero-D-manno-heptose 1,7-bisphosphate phosphatase